MTTHEATNLQRALDNTLSRKTQALLQLAFDNMRTARAAGDTIAYERALDTFLSTPGADAFVDALVHHADR